MLLERADQLELLATRHAEVQERSRGRFVLVAGEAGIGKTALVRAFCEDRPRVLWGACDALYTPRPLGPIVDIGEDLAADGAAPSEVANALAAELRRPAILVLEDLHWADEATLDVVRLLARRIEALPALVIVTYRDDELDRTHPLRSVLGALPSRIADRVAPAPLSPEAVALLASGDVDPGELHRRTGGNRSSSPRRSRPVAAKPSATPSSPAAPGWIRRPGPCSTRSRSCRCGPSCGCSKR